MHVDDGVVSGAINVAQGPMFEKFIMFYIYIDLYIFYFLNKGIYLFLNKKLFL